MLLLLLWGSKMSLVVHAHGEAAQILLVETCVCTLRPEARLKNDPWRGMFVQNAKKGCMCLGTDAPNLACVCRP